MLHFLLAGIHGRNRSIIVEKNDLRSPRLRFVTAARPDPRAFTNGETVSVQFRPFTCKILFTLLTLEEFVNINRLLRATIVQDPSRLG